MRILTGLGTALAALGRHGTSLLPLMAIAGILIPALGHFLKPFVAPTIFVLLLLAFLRVDIVALRTHLKRPLLVAAITAWTMIVIPAALCGVYVLVGIPGRSPDLMSALVLQVATAPMMSSAAIAGLLALDSELVLLGMIACTALVPFSAPLFAQIFVGDAISISPSALAFKLLLILSSSALTAIILRRLAGQARVARYKEQVDGLNVIMMFVFIAALTGDIGTSLYNDPVTALMLTGYAFALTLLLSGVTLAVFAVLGLPQAAALGLLASQRNMGLMLGAAGAALPDLVWLYFGLAQLPIYTLPALMKPLTRKLLRDQQT